MKTHSEQDMAKSHAKRHWAGHDEPEAPDREIHTKIALMIQNARRNTELTQTELAKRIGTHQQAIARLEDQDDDGHSVRVLNRIAQALGLRLSISFDSADDF